MRIVFMGTPDFAVPSLQILVENGYNVVGVITATDKLGGRGKKKVIESAVKKYAISKGLRVLQPKNLKAESFVEELKALKADLQIVVAFRMLPVVVWNMPPIGTINLHGSLLPKFRGAAPIHWAVIQGEKETGVTTFFLKHEIDTGDILLRAKMNIDENETTGDVHDRMMVLGAETVLRSVQIVEKGDYELQPQEESKVSKAPKIFTEDAEINFNQNTEKVHNFIRGMSPFPAAWTMLKESKLKVFRCKKELCEHEELPGNFISDNKNFLKITTKDGYVHLLDLQLQGRKRMKIKDFLNGYKI